MNFLDTFRKPALSFFLKTHNTRLDDNYLFLIFVQVQIDIDHLGL